MPYAQSGRCGREPAVFCVLHSVIPARNRPAELLTAASALLEGIAVHAFLHGGVGFMRADVHLRQRAEVFRAEIVAALLNGAVNVGVLAFVHDVRSFRFSQTVSSMRETAKIESPKTGNLYIQCICDEKSHKCALFQFVMQHRAYARIRKKNRE